MAADSEIEPSGGPAPASRPSESFGKQDHGARPSAWTTRRRATFEGRRPPRPPFHSKSEKVSFRSSEMSTFQSAQQDRTRSATDSDSY